MSKLTKTFGALAILAFLSTPAISGCWNGGEGATGCSTSVTVKIIGIGGTVSCGEGYYACCGAFRARCVAVESQE